MANSALKYPEYVCLDCGEAYGRLPAAGNTSTRVGSCDVCSDSGVIVTAPKTFGGLWDTWKAHKEFA